MIVKNKKVTCESNAVSVDRIYIVGECEVREVAIFVGESVLYTTVFTRFTVI